jgi:hypothetical protein
MFFGVNFSFKFILRVEILIFFKRKEILIKNNKINDITYNFDNIFLLYEINIFFFLLLLFIKIR